MAVPGNAVESAAAAHEAEGNAERTENRDDASIDSDKDSGKALTTDA